MSKIAFVTADHEVDHHNHRELQEKLYRSLCDNPHGVVLDLQKTQFIDSSALGTILHIHRRMMMTGASLVLVLCPNSNILSLLERTRLTDILSIEFSMESAIEALSLKT